MPLTRYKTIIFDSARWENFPFREGDIIISTPPKAGTTWTQRICSLLVFQTAELPQPLTDVSPWFDMLTHSRAELIERLDAQKHRRFIKTHVPMDGLPYDERAIYLCVARDPRDIALSWDNHSANVNPMAFLTARQKAVGNDDIAELLAAGPLPPRAATIEERFWAWVDNATDPTAAPSSLLGTLQHLQSFWQVKDRANVVMLHYADLKADLGGQMRTLAQCLGINIDESRWPELIEAATFERMKSDADRVAPDVTNGIWLNNQQFFNKGTSGQWREILKNAPDLERYRARVRSLVPDDLAQWVHQETVS